MLKSAFVILLLASVTAMPVQAQTILFFGDSLTASYNVPVEKGWVNLLKTQWQSTHPALRLVNASVSGETTSGGLARLPQALAAHQPDLVWLELGANDGLQGFSITVPKGNLAKMIQLCQAHGATVLLAEMYIPPNYGPRYSQAFVSMYGDLAKEFNITLVPFFMARVATQPDYMLADGIHNEGRGRSLAMCNLDPGNS